MPTWVTNSHYLTLGLLLACTVVGIVVAARFRREVDEDLAPTTPRELLDPLENAYYSGLMRPEEIERVRESVKKSATVAVPPTTPARPGRPRWDGPIMPPGDSTGEAGPTHHPGDGGSDPS